MDTDTVQDVTPLVFATIPATTQGKLDMLADLRDRRAAAVLAVDAEIEALQAPIREQLRALEAAKLAATMALDAEISDVEAVIKLDVLKAGATVKGVRLMAVWSKGRVSWDNKRLDGYAMAHPELLA